MTTATTPAKARTQHPDVVQISADGGTIWVHGEDGSTVGRFSINFGMDCHNTVTEMLNGAPECLRCTHGVPKQEHWNEFCDLMIRHHQIHVDRTLINIPE